MTITGGPTAELRIISARRSIPNHLREIWAFRELLASLIRKELKVRYKNSTLGFVWSMVQPVFLLVIYGVAFSILGQGFSNFPVWLMSGLVVWSLVNTTLVTSVQAITVNSNLVGKVNFPRAVLPLATLGSALVHFCLQFLTFIGVLVVVRHHVDLAYIWLLPLAVLALAMLLASAALVLSIANVHARDTQHLLELTMIAFFWAMPIIYEYMRVAKKLSAHHLPTWLPLVNPITSIIITFQRALYGTASIGGRQLLPDASVWWYLRNIGIVGAASVVLLLLALQFFDRSEGNLAEML
jgi:ABC-2 type transport system permease protein